MTSPPRLGVIDLGISNVRSVTNALARVSVPCTLVDGRLPDAGPLLLPGVGAFGDGMASLRARGLVEPLRRAAGEGRTILGICLGMQLLADGSDEYGDHAGLGLIPGRVTALDAARERVPNIGWCDVTPCGASALFPSAAEPRASGRSFYFAHGYALTPANDADVAATITFGGAEVVAAVARGTVLGAQFHPEKSQDAGLDLLARVFAAIAPAGTTC